MAVPIHSALALAIAIGIGLLIGAERERRKGSGSRRGAAEIRTFALAAFAGALSRYLNSELKRPRSSEQHNPFRLSSIAFTSTP